jgi:hypothetical protein
VQFEPRELEDVVARLNRFKRVDEKPFEAVAALSEFLQGAYRLFAQPLVQATANEATAEASRRFHPLRWQRWAVSDANPWLWWLAPLAETVREQRAALEADEPLRQAEAASVDLASAALDLYRDLRDAGSEGAFFQTYGTLFGLLMAEQAEAARAVTAGDGGQRYVKAALEAVEHGGYAAALARVAALLARRGVAIDLDTIALKKELIADYRELLPPVDFATARRVRGEQDLIVAHAPELALETLPKLLAQRGDRERFARFFERVLGDSRVSQSLFTDEQRATFRQIWSRLGLAVPGAAVAVTRSKRRSAPARRRAA